MSSEQCARPNCRSGPDHTRSTEWRVHGYCGHECETLHDLELHIAALQRDLAHAEQVARQIAPLREYVALLERTQDWLADTLAIHGVAVTSTDVAEGKRLRAAIAEARGEGT